ncbi:Transposase IS3/IS911 family protein [human gut metagenome]|uniref:Transposase IS3/IS911 family protein n=1 Tax=human gut metagenome TaxID=408170 RepID=W1XZJ6_9ZZZZ
MGRIVKSYTQEYKNTIVNLFNSGKTYAELSDEYRVPKTTIRQWGNKAHNTNKDEKIMYKINCHKEMAN